MTSGSEMSMTTSQTEQIIWEDPSEGSQGDGPFEDICQDLKEHQGVWGRIGARSSPSEAGYIVGRIKNAKGIWAGGKWEATQRTINAEKVMYAKYLGDVKDAGEITDNPE